MISVFFAPGSPARTIARFSSIAIEINNDDARHKKTGSSYTNSRQENDIKIHEDYRKADRINLPSSHTDEFAWNFIV
jgi:hypothetical protein